MTYPFEHLLTQTQTVCVKLEQLVKPFVPPEKWSLIEENVKRIETFVQQVGSGLPETYTPEITSDLDAVFGSDVFDFLNERLQQINEILSHSSYGEAACSVNEVLSILNEAIDILDMIYDILYGAEVGLWVCCFVGGIPCCAALPWWKSHGRLSV